MNLIDAIRVSTDRWCVVSTDEPFKIGVMLRRLGFTVGVGESYVVVDRDSDMGAFIQDGFVIIPDIN